MEPRVLQHHIAGEGEPLVLVPGGLAGWLSWIPHQERLQDHHRVVRVQPVHNELGAVGRLGDPGYSAAVERENLRLTLDALAVEEADFAGWSSGGRALIEFAVSFPDRVRSLTLVEPAAYRFLAQEQMEVDPRLVELEEFLAGLAGKEVSEEALIRFLLVAGFGSRAAEVRSNPRWPVWWEVRNALSWEGYLGATHRALDVSGVDCPVLLVKGTVTVPWQRQVVDLLAGRFPDVRVLELEGDHACHIQSIDRFLKELEHHLSRR